MRWFPRALSLALALIALAGCGALPPERRVDLIVTASGYATPVLEGRAGEQLFIRFKNDDAIAHSLTVELPSGSRTVSAEDGVDAILALSLRDAGTFRMFCSVAGHTEEGELVVLPAE